MRAAFLHVGIFIVINVPLTVVLSLGLAVALNAAIPFRGFLRAAYYIPYVTASVAVVAVWLWLFSRQGLVNTVLGPLAPDPSGSSNSVLAMPMIAVFVAWKQAGFFILLYLAALQNVPRSSMTPRPSTAPRAGSSFLNVTVPGVRPATVLVVVLATITGANLFTEPYLLTGRRRARRRLDHAGAADVPARDRAGPAGRRGGDRDHARRSACSCCRC